MPARLHLLADDSSVWMWPYPRSTGHVVDISNDAAVARCLESIGA